MPSLSDRDYRLAGIFIAIIGAGLTYWGLWRPVMQALNGIEAIDYSLTASVIEPLAAIVGLFMLVMGGRAEPTFTGQISKPFQVVLILGFIVYLSSCVWAWIISSKPSAMIELETP